MKSLYFFLYTLSFISLHSTALANTYIVLHVKGEIKNQATGKLLKPSDKVNDDEKIVFLSKDAVAVVIHPTKGRHLLKHASTSNSSSNELVAFVRETLISGVSANSTRAGKLTNDLAFETLFKAPLKDGFFRGQFAILGQSAQYEVATETYPLDGMHFFFARYQYNGETINKKIPHQGSSFQLDASSLYRIDGQPIDPQEASNFALHYRNATDKSSRMLCHFNPIFVDAEELKKEIELLINYYLKGKAKEEIIGELTGFMADSYGKVEQEAFESFLLTHFPNLW